MTALRPYQQQALEAEARHRAEHPDETRLAIVMATGLGKGTIIAERAVRAIEDPMFAGRVLILAHTDEIVTDLAKRCELLAGRSEFPITIGIVKAERDETTADIIVASVQTLANPVRRAAITDVGLVIVDECHHGTADSYQAIMRAFGCFVEGECPMHGEYCACVPPAPVPALGFTATLERGDGRGLGDIWQNVAFTRSIGWGVRHGYLVQPVGHRLEIDVTNPAASWPIGRTGAFLESVSGQDAQLIEALAPEKIVEKWIELAKDRPTVAFMPLVRSARVLADAFTDAGYPAAVIWGDMPRDGRMATLHAYERGDVKVLVNAMVLTEGWDSPHTKCVIVGRPTKSRSLFVQMAGRGLRPVLGIPVEEQDCVLLCVADATADLCSVADLSDRPIDRKAQGALTAMEDQWDIGRDLADETKFWTGQVDAREFDPLVVRSSKVWRTTKHGTPFLPISKDGEYVFIVGTSVFVRELTPIGQCQMKVRRLHKDLPDLELALSVAEDEAQERGGDLGKLLADKGRPWRKQVPSTEMQEHAQRLGLGRELAAIMESRAGGKAGKLSDHISRVLATRALEPMVEKIKEATADAPEVR